MLIIFITAYPDYVFQGYEVHAFHYILKPYEKNKLKEVLESAVKELSSLEEQFYLVTAKILELSVSASVKSLILRVTGATYAPYKKTVNRFLFMKN